jgi:hypothetical protein
MVTKRDFLIDHRQKMTCHHMGRVFPDRESVLRGLRNRFFEDQDTGREQVRGRRRVQTDGLPVTGEAFSGMKHLTPHREFGTLKHWLRTVRDRNAEDGSVTTEGTAVEEITFTISFPITLPSGPSDRSAALKLPTPPIAAQKYREPFLPLTPCK